MVDLSASIGIKAMLDTSGVERGKGKIVGLFDEITRKGKETNVFFMRATGLLKGLMKLGVGFGAGIVAGITGLVAASPQFKAFLASLKAPWMKLTLFFGETFKPILDKISKKFGEFVGVVTGSKDVRDFFDKWVTKIGEFLETIKKKDMENFMAWITKLADTTLTYTFNIAGTLKSFLFGEDNKGGLIGFLRDTEEIIERTLRIDIDAGDKVLGILSAAMFLTGHPVVGGLLAAGLVGKGIEKTVGEPKGGYGLEGVPPWMWASTSLISFFETMMDKVDPSTRDVIMTATTAPGLYGLQKTADVIRIIVTDPYNRTEMANVVYQMRG